MLREAKNITMGKTWLSYIGSAWGALRAAGLWDGGEAELAAASGLAFQFIVHESFCPSSVTVYDWAETHFAAMDRIGVHTDHLAVVFQPGLNTAAELQADAVNRIRASIDRGRGVVAWAPTPLLEFGIITGYDDEERIFSVIDCVNPKPDPLLYDNLGRGEVPMLYLQRFHSRRAPEREKNCRDALGFAVSFWRSAHDDPRYGRGARAYDHMLRSLKAGDYNPFGVGYCLAVYACAKEAAAAYLQKAAADRVLAGLDGPAGGFARIASLFREAADLVPFRGPQGTTVDSDRVSELVKSFKECKKLEGEAIDGIAAAIGAEAPAKEGRA